MPYHPEPIHKIGGSRHEVFFLLCFGCAFHHKMTGDIDLKLF